MNSGAVRPVHHVYCDESHVVIPATGYRIQGGIWVPSQGMRAVRQAFSGLRARHAKLHEFKWSYVTGATPLTAYCDLVDLFFDSGASEFLSFKCLVIQGAHDASRALDKVGKDIGFYKAYFTLLRYRLLAGCDHHVRIDKRTSPRSTPEADLMRCLNYALQRGEPFRVLSCEAIPSGSEDLLQLADVLCGVVAWAWNGMRSTCGAKPQLHRRICERLGWKTLEGVSTGAGATKFNVWNYKPKAGAPAA